MKSIFVSIITASYNSEKTIARTIESVLEQNFDSFEYIIIDGNSKDNTMAIVKSYSDLFERKNIDYRWLSESDSGIYNAWNKGVKMANGKWISFLGSDDIYVKNALKIYCDKLKFVKNPTFDFVHSEVDIVKNEKVIKKIDGEWKWRKFRRFMNIAHVGALHNANYFRNYGLFDEKYKICGDYELLLRARENLSTLKIKEITAIMGSDGMSNTLVNQAFSETYIAKNRTAQVGSFLCAYDYILAWLKYYLKKFVHASHR